MEYASTQKEKRTFKDIILDHLNKILELSCDEFRGGYIEKKIRGNFVEEFYIPDSRKRITQAIEFLSFLLQPLYDDDMNKKSDAIKKEITENLKKFNDKKIDRDNYRICKLNSMKSLFEELNYLLVRKDYLKAKTKEDTEDD